MRVAGVADEAHAPRLEIGKPADIVVHGAVARDRQRIDGEVAPLRIRLPVAAERDLGLAAEGLDILAQRRHFERPAVDHHRDRAVLDAGRHRLEAGAPATRRITSSGSAVVATSISPGGSPMQRVAHRAADHARLLAVAIEHREQARERPSRQPGGAIEADARCAVTSLLPRNEFAVLHMRRHIGAPWAARRRIARARRSCRAPGASAATVSQASFGHVQASRVEHLRPRRQQEHRIERRTAPGTAQSRSGPDGSSEINPLVQVAQNAGRHAPD